ncbi:MAG: TetR/AcrR family transcriptional regulator [Pseudomonadales bacterium]
MQSPAEDQKANLNNALRSVFLRSGYAGASVARLAAATELGKASLYHYFPGGKEEMGRSLVREAVAHLQQRVFSQLGRGSNPVEAICLTIDAFSDYVEGGAQNCLIAQFSQENAPVIEQEQIRSQFEEWQRQLASRYEDMDLKPKAALRAARKLTATLYGHLLLANLLGDPKEFRRGVKRLKAELIEQS